LLVTMLTNQQICTLHRIASEQLVDDACSSSGRMQRTPVGRCARWVCTHQMAALFCV